MSAERVYAFADSVAEDVAATEQHVAQLETWVTFRMAGEVFGFAVEAIQEIVRVGDIVRVPHAPYAVRGIFNVRGRVVPVMDLRIRLGLAPADPGPHSRILIAPIRGRLLGLLVDSVEQVERIDRLRVTAPPDDVMTEHSEYINGVYQNEAAFLILLDAERVLLIPDGLEARNAETI